MIDWNTVRYFVVYPALIVGGAAWAILFYLQCRRCARLTTVWGTAIGIALAVTGVVGELTFLLDPSKHVLRLIGPPIMLIPAFVIVAGSLHLFFHELVDRGDDGP